MESALHLPLKLHSEQIAEWPVSGHHILANFGPDTIVVYQAYRESIGRFAARHQHFGSEFSFNRMSWIKPNFLWMMYRSGWGTKEGQEVTLGLRLRRAFFERVVREAVPSTFDPVRYPSREAWQEAVGPSEVRLQWDPDHAPSGNKLERRAIQLGLRGRTLAAFAREELLEVIDMRAFVEAQRPMAHNDNPELQLPVEHPLDIEP